jgi:hypothetical protein
MQRTQKRRVETHSVMPFLSSSVAHAQGSLPCTQNYKRAFHEHLRTINRVHKPAGSDLFGPLAYARLVEAVLFVAW